MKSNFASAGFAVGLLRLEEISQAEFQLHALPWQRHAAFPAQQPAQTNSILP
jgi:hypothetical protein